MSSSTPSSYSGLALVGLLAGCAAEQVPVTEAVSSAQAPRLILLPAESLERGFVPLEHFRESLVKTATAVGLNLVPEEELELFLARHRVRYTGGVTEEIAAAARDELNADAFLITSLSQRRTAGDPAVALHMRLVSTGAVPMVLWIGGAAKTGIDTPGLLGLGIVRDLEVLQQAALTEVLEALKRFVLGQDLRSSSCEDGRFGPYAEYLAPGFDRGVRRRTAVLPFRNRSGRGRASEVVALDFVRALHASDRLELVEPGVVREALLNYRIVLPDGVSLDQARLVLSILDAELVVSGEIFDYADQGPVPIVGFSVFVLDKERGALVWRSSSHARGDDGVFFFDLGLVRSAGVLSCRMAQAVVERFYADLEPSEEAAAAPEEGVGLGQPEDR